jgi:hypothetical protein
MAWQDGLIKQNENEKGQKLLVSLRLAIQQYFHAITV